jgi:hypothetical protein
MGNVSHVTSEERVITKVREHLAEEMGSSWMMRAFWLKIWC